jgi:hypothetical protein
MRRFAAGSARAKMVSTNAISLSFASQCAEIHLTVPQDTREITSGAKAIMHKPVS